MDIDVEALLRPVSEDNPTGEDMDYDPARHTIQEAFESSPSIDVNGDQSTGVDVNWNKTIQAIVDQFGQTKDVWLPTYLCRAGARAGKLDVVVTGAEALAGLFERYWDTAHPRLDELGIPGRKAPCDALTIRSEFLGPLERTPLITHPRLGSYSGVDLERFRTGGDSEDGYGYFKAALEELGSEALATARASLAAIEGALRRADTIFTESAAASGESSTNFQPTYAVLSHINRSIDAFQRGEASPEAEVAPETDRGGGGAPAAGGGRLSGSIDSRDDVIRAIDAICDYYKRREPSSPVPMALLRAREWVKLDFLKVLEDIAPDSLNEVRRVLVRREEEN
jgi:type VI secretion system ImpA family protein